MKKNIKYIALIIVVLIIGIVALSICTRSPLEKSMRRDGYVYFIIVGLDSVENLSRADSIILGKMSSQGSLRLMSIPRDTKVSYLGKQQRINGVFARGFSKGGIKGGCDKLSLVLEENFHIRPLRYAVLDYAVFESVIDMMGGVEVYVSRDMYYFDKNGQLLIDIKKGVNHFDGKRSLEFVRYRSDGRGDIGRIQRQKDFMSSILGKNSIREYMKNLKIIRFILSKLKTNFRIKEAFYIKDLLASFDGASVIMKTLPGGPEKEMGGSYWIPKKNFDYDKCFLKGQKEERKKILVELLNGNGVPGFGEAFATKLRQFGYDVVSIKNADRMNYDQSVVFYNTGRHSDIEAIKNNFGIELIYPREEKGVFDVQIILGKDLIDDN